MLILAGTGCLIAVVLSGCGPADQPVGEGAGTGGATSSLTSDPSEHAGETVSPPETIDARQFDFELTDSPEVLAQKYLTLTTAEVVGNMTNEIVFDQRFTEENISLSLDEYAQTMATIHVTNLFDAQYVSDWRNQPNLKAAFDQAVEQNATNILNYVNTPEELKVSQTLSSYEVVSQDENSITLRITSVFNYDGDSIDTRNEEALNGKIGARQVTFTNVDGRRVISDRLVVGQ